LVSGCGKIDLFKQFQQNERNLNQKVRFSGEVLLDGRDIFIIKKRKRSHKFTRLVYAMVFQPVPIRFPWVFMKGGVFGITHSRQNERRMLDDIVESSLRNAALWDEVKGAINFWLRTALLSGGHANA